MNSGMCDAITWMNQLISWQAADLLSAADIIALNLTSDERGNSFQLGDFTHLFTFAWFYHTFVLKWSISHKHRDSHAFVRNFLFIFMRSSWVLEWVVGWRLWSTLDMWREDFIKIQEGPLRNINEILWVIASLNQQTFCNDSSLKWLKNDGRGLGRGQTNCDLFRKPPQQLFRTHTFRHSPPFLIGNNQLWFVIDPRLFRYHKAIWWFTVQ